MRRRPVRSSILPVLVSAALVIPNLVVIVLGVEDFPFTTAPMFAHYVEPDSQLYVFRFEGVRDGIGEPLPVEATNRSERDLQRQFLTWYYRPMTDTSPFRDLSGPPATPDQLATRMTNFFGPIADFLRHARGLRYDSIRLEIDIVDTTGAVIATEHVGDYDVSTGHYSHAYEVTQ